MKKLFYILVLLGALATEGHAQQAPLYSQYLLNGFLLNPAVAGSEGYSAVNLTAREQWVGLNGGPSTYALSFQTRLMKQSHISRSKRVSRKKKSPFRGGNVGLGGYVFNLRNGAVDRTGVRLTYAYHIPLDKAQLSFGLSIKGFQYRVDKTRIDMLDPGDAVYMNLDQSVFIPDADFGVYYMSSSMWAGFSVDQLLESALKFGGEGYEQMILERTYNLMAGYDYMIQRDVFISPSALVKFAENGKVQADISVNAYFQQAYWFGLSYRTVNTLVLGGGVSVDRLVFGYAYDIGLNSLMKYSYGTHEFTMIVKLGDQTRRHRWLTRY